MNPSAHSGVALRVKVRAVCPQAAVFRSNIHTSRRGGDTRALPYRRMVGRTCPQSAAFRSSIHTSRRGGDTAPYRLSG